MSTRAILKLVSIYLKLTLMCLLGHQFAANADDRVGDFRAASQV